MKKYILALLLLVPGAIVASDSAQGENSDQIIDVGDLPDGVQDQEQSDFVAVEPVAADDSANGNWFSNAWESIKSTVSGWFSSLGDAWESIKGKLSFNK